MAGTSDSRKDKLSYPENIGDDFRIHDEEMKKFRSTHPKEEIARPKNIKPRLFLIPLPSVDLGSYLQN